MLFGRLFDRTIGVQELSTDAWLTHSAVIAVRQFAGADFR